MILRDILSAIEAVAPRELQESYDNAGLQCGDPHQEVSRVLTCLDVTEEVLAEARRRDCQLVVSHHPLLFRGVKCISPEAGYIPRILIDAIRNGIAIYSAHTNLDKAEGGTNHYLADLLGLKQLQPMSECGVWGVFEQPVTAQELLHRVEDRLLTRVRYNRDARILLADPSSHEPSRLLSSLALCTGSGGEFIAEAETLGVDAYLTGEIRYHDFFGHQNLLLIEAGHFETEQFVPEIFSRILQQFFPAIECFAAESQVNPCPFL